MDNTLIELLREYNARELHIVAAEEWIARLEKQLVAHGIGFPGIRPRTVTINVAEE